MEYIDLIKQYLALKSRIDKEIQDILYSGRFILGEAVLQFEKELADYIGVKHAISCSDGTSALQLLYMAYGIGSGDAVFCPDMTFIASIEPACLLGATPVFCDIDPVSYNINPKSLENQIEKVISEGILVPKAVVAVDFLGNPAEYDIIRDISNEYGLILIEDAAQAMGASYKGKKCGSLGDAGATSFFPSKPLGCYGDGGAVFTDDDTVAELIRSLRSHGKGEDKYHNVRIGINSRLDSIQAAVLRAKLNVLDEEIDKRQEVALCYNKAFNDKLRCPVIDKNSVSSYAQYVVIADSEEKREKIQNSLSEIEIPTLRYYPVPMHLLPVFSDTETYGEDFSVAEAYACKSFGIPFSAYITDDEVSKVISGVLSAVDM